MDDINKDKNYLDKLNKIINEYREKFGSEIYFKYFPNNQNKKQIIPNNELKQIFIEVNDFHLLRKYKNLFFNRIDVYAKYWETNNACGYVFSCENEWNKQKCLKLKGSQCKLCENKVYKKMTKDVLYEHLNGNQVIGTYAINKNNESKFLVFDFDEENWRNEIILLKNEMDKLKIKSYIELSKSSNGAHLWIFFESYKKAKLIRLFARIIMIKILDENPGFNFSSFDRIFPSQNELAQNGLGNLICLPYSKKFLTTNSHCFINEEYEPINIIDFINNVEVNKDLFVDELIEKHKQEVEDLLKEDNKIFTNNQINIVKSNEIIFNLNELNNSIIKFLRKISSLYNPEYFINEKIRKSNYATPMVIDLSRIKIDKIYIPRGLEDKILKKFKENNIDYKIFNGFNKQHKIKLNDSINLSNEQEFTFLNLIKKNMGILSAPTGFGKTVLALKIISHLKLKTLIIVNSIIIAKQWFNAINKFLHIDKNKICMNDKILKDISIKTVQSYIQLSEEELKKQTKEVNLLLIDECHHFASVAYEKVIRTINAKYIYGFSATPKRSDGLTKILNMRMGDTVESVKLKNNVIKKLFIKESEFNVVLNNELSLNEYNLLLIKDKNRNLKICNDALDENKKNNTVLIIVEWVQHIMYLYDILKERTNNLVLLHGQLSDKDLKIELQKLKINTNKIILATGKFIGEGFDIPDINVLIVGSPFKWSGKQQQYIGRIRINENKKEVIVIDYLDKNISIFYKMFAERLKTYKKLGFSINDDNKYNQVIYNELDSIIQIDNDLKNSQKVITNIDNTTINKLFKNKNVTRAINNKQDFIIIDNKFVWLLIKNFWYRIVNNPYLVDEIIELSTII